MLCHLCRHAGGTRQIGQHHGQIAQAGAQAGLGARAGQIGIRLQVCSIGLHAQVFQPRAVHVAHGGCGNRSCARQNAINLGDANSKVAGFRRQHDIKEPIQRVCLSQHRHFGGPCQRPAGQRGKP